MAGYQLMIAGDVLRGRVPQQFEKPEPLWPGAVEPYTIDLRTRPYRFRRGHRIMVQVQSTWFPLIDRNPQTCVPNIFTARGPTSDRRRTACIGRRRIPRGWSCR